MHSYYSKYLNDKITKAHYFIVHLHVYEKKNITEEQKKDAKWRGKFITT